jgi:hypothetical protein
VLDSPAEDGGHTEMFHVKHLGARHMEIFHVERSPPGAGRDVSRETFGSPVAEPELKLTSGSWAETLTKIPWHFEV